MTEQSAFTMIVREDDHGKRFDCFVAEKIDETSRSQISDLISNGFILINEIQKKPAYKLKENDVIAGSIPPPTPLEFLPEKIDLNILYEDRDIIVVNKQAGLVVHPAPGNWTGTLVNALLYHFPEIKGVASEIRPGIVHRLDRDTSGVIIVAKNRTSHIKLSDAFKSREVYKEYTALLYGDVSGDKGIIDLPVGRHPVDRKRMSVQSSRGRNAETHWFVEERLTSATRTNFVIKTGRTHQIRVHCKSMGHPVVGDIIYSGKRNSFVKRYGSKSESVFKKIDHHLLHSKIIKFLHPTSNNEMVFEAPLPEDFICYQQQLKNLQKNISTF